MADSSWDNGGMGQPAKRGWPVWAKLLMGCGIVVLLGVTGCVVGAASCVGAIKNAANAEWNATRAMVRQLETDEGARAVYQANPRLAATFPDEGRFLEAAQGWRPRLEPLPEQMPGLMTGNINLNISSHNGHRKVDLSYTNSKGTRMTTEWQDGRLADITVH